MNVSLPGRLDQAQSAIAALFQGQAAVAVTDPRQTQPDPFAEEASHVVHALPVRQREFAAGRAAARRAMGALGMPGCAVPAAADRSPIWPEGLRGSISHSASLCAAVVTQAPLLIGLDLEENTDLNADLVPSLCSDAEIARIAGPQELRLAKLIFSAKEAAYKAQYPVTGMLFGFDHIDVTLDLEQQRFEAKFVKPAGCFAIGDCLPGKFIETSGHLVTAVITGQTAPEEAEQCHH